ncbi:MAG: PhoH family protein [Proteobacteria bacterium]|nr:PhoH family protein [Pseudomonadota bacterium]
MHSSKPLPKAADFVGKPGKTTTTATRPASITITMEFADNQLLPSLYGHHNSNLKAIEAELDVELTSFGNVIRVSGKETEVLVAKQALHSMYQRMQNTTPDQSQAILVEDALRWARSENGKTEASFAAVPGIATYRRTVVAKSKAQQDYLTAIAKHDVVFGLGPAGTGKTYLAVARAVEAFKNREVERLVLARPAVEAGERLGFLPGDMKEKIDPYLRPLYDALYDMVPSDMLKRMLDCGQVEIAPLAFMRGRTLAHAFVIIDEAQNTNPVQMKMVLTRLGDKSKMVITGDLEQIDLPHGQKSGLADAVAVLDGVQSVAMSRFDRTDVVRPPVVGRILLAYDDASKQASKQAGKQ